MSMGRIFTICYFLFIFNGLFGQGVYNMSNTTVTDCNGIFIDSDNGTPAANYGHNEDYTFKICPPGASQVTLNFSSFCTEQFLDVIRFFDGPDTNSTLILSHSGSGLPGTVTASLGCLTIHFKSDANIACTGWMANWSVNLVPPSPPNIQPIASAPCFSSSFNITLDHYIPCDSVYVAAFGLSGPANPNIASALPVNCTGDSTNTISLSVTPQISKNGSYNITFSYSYKDVCDSIWQFNVSQSFYVNDCPIEAKIIASKDTICAGQCISLSGDATGGDSTTYSFSWGQGIPPGKGPHIVCPQVTTTYSLIVSDQGPSPSDTAYKTIVVASKPFAGNDFTLCQSAGAIKLNGQPAGGSWSGNGITSGNNGLFNPDIAGGGQHLLIYNLSGCSDTVIANVTPIDAGPDEGACPGTTSFPLSGHYPGGGTWSGDNITSSGIYTPDSFGIFPVMYSAPNGCQDTKFIHVDTIILQPNDTTCTNIGSYFLNFSPSGGIWTGNGIVDTFIGEFSPALAGPGSHTLSYSLNGCSDSLVLVVLPINAGKNFTTCPYEGLVSLPTPAPGGGFWSGQGVVDSINGIFDPAAKGLLNFNQQLYYHFGGCQDTVIAYVRKTNIAYDSLYFCVDDPVFYLNHQNTGRNVNDGKWSGTGVIDPDFPGRFDPMLAGPGNHQLYYDANNCMDSVIMVVYDLPIARDTVVCETSPSFNLQGAPTGGIWRGTGITDSTTGLFNPAKAGVGTFYIVYDAYVGCKDTCTITVSPLANITISGIDATYCFKDTMIAVSATPFGGTLSGSGIIGNNFNPYLAGPGLHYVKYSFGSGDCAVEDSTLVLVSDSITINMPFTTDSICYGEKVNVSVSGSGGWGGTFSYQWNKGLGQAHSISLAPKTSTNYSLTVTDGCSEPAVQQLNIFVFPEIIYTVETAPIFCYSDTGYARIIAPLGRTYAYEWLTNPVLTTDSIPAIAGTYYVDISDQNSGCTQSATIPVEGYDFINAKFTPSPNVDCISSLDPQIHFIDFSTGGISGWWAFGDGDTILYSSEGTVDHTFPGAGQYEVTLYIENEGGCYSVYRNSICVEAAKTLWVPTAITPGGNGNNTHFKAKGIGITEFTLMIFNRWGEKIFETNDINEGWDGTYNGQRVQNDAYAYLIQYKDITSNRPYILKGSFAVIW